MKCPTCNGSGIEQRPYFRGTGEVTMNKCRDCNGTGEVDENENESEK